MIDIKNVKIEIYLPEENIHTMVEQLTMLGACKVGEYDHVVSYGKVFGTWRPLEHANPVNGNRNEINNGDEFKMEVICPYELYLDAVKVIKENHPYEEPLINVLPLLDF